MSESNKLGQIAVVTEICPGFFDSDVITYYSGQTICTYRIKCVMGYEIK